MATFCDFVPYQGECALHVKGVPPHSLMLDLVVSHAKSIDKYGYGIANDDAGTAFEFTVLGDTEHFSRLRFAFELACEVPAGSDAEKSQRTRITSFPHGERLHPLTRYLEGEEGWITFTEPVPGPASYRFVVHTSIRAHLWSLRVGVPTPLNA